MGALAAIVLVAVMFPPSATGGLAAPIGIPGNGYAAVPPISVFPPATGATPPASATSDPLNPDAACSAWYVAGSYGGRWPAGSSWWEYNCSVTGAPWCPGPACDAVYGPPPTWGDYYYWDGARAVFYGQVYDTGAYYAVDPTCTYWWDDPTQRWYPIFDCGVPPPNQPPFAAFIAGCSGLNCTFYASGSQDPDGSIIAYSWTFGDGASASGFLAGHVFGHPGTYIVSLSVTDNLGATSTASREISVVDAPPVAGFTFSCLRFSCSFDGSASGDPDGTIQGYSWSFGDGAVGSGLAAQHIYAVPGGYTVSLVVTDDGGGTGATSNLVTVMTLKANASRANGHWQVALSWSGSPPSSFDVLRNGASIVATSGTTYTDTPSTRGTYVYQVCTKGASSCSNTTTVTF